MTKEKFPSKSVERRIKIQRSPKEEIRKILYTYAFGTGTTEAETLSAIRKVIFGMVRREDNGIYYEINHDYNSALMDIAELFGEE